MLEEIKSYLKITWDDENDVIQSYIARGKATISDLCGAELNFTEENHAKALLFDYCRYAYNNALEYFEDNFYSQIARLQYKVAMEELKDEE